MEGADFDAGVGDFLGGLALVLLVEDRVKEPAGLGGEAESLLDGGRLAGAGAGLHDEVAVAALEPRENCLLLGRPVDGGGRRRGGVGGGRGNLATADEGQRLVGHVRRDAPATARGVPRAAHRLQGAADGVSIPGDIDKFVVHGLFYIIGPEACQVRESRKLW